MTNLVIFRNKKFKLKNYAFKKYEKNSKIVILSYYTKKQFYSQKRLYYEVMSDKIGVECNIERIAA